RFLALPPRLRKKLRNRRVSRQPTFLICQNLKTKAIRPAHRPLSKSEAATCCSCQSRALAVLPPPTNSQSTSIKHSGRLRLSSRHSPPVWAWPIQEVTTLANGRTAPAPLVGSMEIPSPWPLPSEPRVF